MEKMAVMSDPVWMSVTKASCTMGRLYQATRSDFMERDMVRVVLAYE